MIDIVFDEERMLWLDDETEEGLITLGLYAPYGDGAITLDKNETLALLTALTKTYKGVVDASST